MEMKVIGPGGREGLEDALRQALGMKDDSEYPFRPATLADIRGLLEGSAQDAFAVGDIVKLRPFAANDFRWPSADDRCIVTQVLDTPYREGDAGTSQTAQRQDIALAFVKNGGDEGRLVEFLHDSRRFEKIGSIYDPVITTDDESLSVE